MKNVTSFVHVRIRRVSAFFIFCLLCTVLVYASATHAALGDDLVGYWKFDETTGITSYDSSSHGSDGTLIGTPDISATVPTLQVSNLRSLDFNGSSDYVTMGDKSILEVEDGPFSISLWFRPHEAPGAGSSWVFVAKGTPSVAGYAFQYEHVGGQYVINVSKYGVADQRVTISQLSTDTWYNLIAVQRSGEVEYYINGTSVGTYSNASSYNASGSNEFRVGAASNSSLYAYGLIDEVLVYNRALTSSEITSLAAGEAVAGAPVPEFSLWLYIPIFFGMFWYACRRVLVV